MDKTWTPKKEKEIGRIQVDDNTYIVVREVIDDKDKTNIDIRLFIDSKNYTGFSKGVFLPKDRVFKLIKLLEKGMDS